jgi:hypothetical protein
MKTKNVIKLQKNHRIAIIATGGIIKVLVLPENYNNAEGGI